MFRLLVLLLAGLAGCKSAEDHAGETALAYASTPGWQPDLSWPMVCANDQAAKSLVELQARVAALIGIAPSTRPDETGRQQFWGVLDLYRCWWLQWGPVPEDQEREVNDGNPCRQPTRFNQVCRLEAHHGRARPDSSVGHLRVGEEARHGVGQRLPECGLRGCDAEVDGPGMADHHRGTLRTRSATRSSDIPSPVLSSIRHRMAWTSS